METTTKLEIGKLELKDYIQHDKMCYKVFFSFGENSEEYMEKINSEDFKPEEFEDYKEYTCWGAKQENKLLSSLQTLPYTIRMNGKDVSMAGIGGVITLPEARGNGYVSQIMNKVLPDLYDSGVMFSVLYPFSYEYYRKFGYEMCFIRNNVTIDISLFSSYNYPKTIKEYKPEGSITPFETIYKTFCENRNFAIVRDENAWKKLLKRDPYKKFEFTYLYHNNKNEATAYILYKCDYDHSNGNSIEIEELCWKEPAGLLGIFGFLGKLSSEYARVKWNVPSNLDVFTMFPDAYDVTWNRKSHGMCRIVNVLEALKTLSAPEGTGKVIIDVNDSSLNINTGKYCVEWFDNKLIVDVEKEKSDTEPSISTSIHTLTQLVTGYLTPEEAAYKKDTVIFDSYAELIKLFPRRNLYIKESF